MVTHVTVQSSAFLFKIINVLKSTGYVMNNQFNIQQL